MSFLCDLIFLFLKIVVFIHTPRKERGMVWRDTPALRGGDLEFLVDYNEIKNGWEGVALMWPLAVGAL